MSGGNQPQGRRADDVMAMHEPSDLLTWMDICDREEIDLEIEGVSGGEVIGDGGRKKKMPMVKFRGGTKRLGLNKTNTRTLIALYGKFAKDWVGKWCTLYVTTTSTRDGVVNCIRVRPQAPRGRQASRPVEASKAAPPPTTEPSAEERAAIEAAEREEAARG